MSGRRLVPAYPWTAGVFLCVITGVSAAAADTPGAACLRVDDEKARLACFDEAIGAAVREAGEDAVASRVVVPAGATSGATAGAEAPPLSSSETGLSYARETPPPPGQLIDRAWGFLPESRKAYVRLHQPNYLLFARYTTDVNREPYEPLFEAFAEDYDFEDVEAKFQLSVKGRLLTTDDRRWGLWFAYTQQSQWQVYSSDISSPFRETNYQPEVFVSFRPDVQLGDFRCVAPLAGVEGNFVAHGPTSAGVTHLAHHVVHRLHRRLFDAGGGRGFLREGLTGQRDRQDESEKGAGCGRVFHVLLLD
jgi:phospholipase A1